MSAWPEPRLRLQAERDASPPQEVLADDPVRLHRWILAEGVRRGASDVHLDLEGGELRVRFSQDGCAVEALRLPGERIDNLLARFRSDARLPLGGRELQGGGFSFSVDGAPWDARVQVLFNRQEDPRLILRLLPREGAGRPLADLGLAPPEIAALREAVKRRDGMVVIAGPTGAGKSTTLFALLHELNRPDRVIYTLEDPPEYRLPGATQVACASLEQEANPSRPTFANGLRALLRAAPDIVLVGEIRDAATASTAVEAAITGHLILTSVHASDSPGAIRRLLRLGADPLALAEGLRLAGAQRLLRRVCGCHALAPPPAGLVPPPGKRPQLAIPCGCSRCFGSGYRGRFPVLETLPSDLGLITDLARGGIDDAWLRAARRAGRRTLAEAALNPLWQGLTTLDEVERQIPPDPPLAP